MLIGQDFEEGAFPKMKTVILFVLRTAAVRVQAIGMSDLLREARLTWSSGHGRISHHLSSRKRNRTEVFPSLRGRK
jgi:hypothetical protein